MVLITGPSACGKSSTMAALVNLINEERAEHILTIEDPIEYLHASKRCVVNQRNVKRHTESFARALRAALREDPDVIVIGELRDRETISLAMTAAETGHLVLATLHTDNAVRTVNRIIGSFPPAQQDQVRAMISESLRAVISQRLLPRADARGMVPAVEILVVNRPVANLIREEKTVQIRSTMQTGAAAGMCLLDGSLAQLVKSGTVKRDEALIHAEDPKLIPPGK
jgi:twitching motility protein PilT